MSGPSDRFRSRPVVEVTAPDGTRRRVVPLLLDPLPDPGEGLHRVVLGDAVDAIARRHLGDESLWWKLLDVNPVRYPLDLTPGEVLHVPARGLATRADRTRTF